MSFFKCNKTKPTVTILEKCIPEIIINPNALIQMQLYIEQCTEEVGWLGTAIMDKKTIYIDEVFLFEQEVHSTTTEITPQGLSTFAEALLQQPDGMEIWNNIKVWGHSHVNMTTSPSGQDDKQMETFSEGGHDWFIRIIGNKKGEITIDLYDYQLGIIYKNLPWEEANSVEEEELFRQLELIEEQLDKIRKSRKKKFEDFVKQEVATKVKKKSYITTYPQGGRVHAVQGVRIPITEGCSDLQKKNSNTTELEVGKKKLITGTDIVITKADIHQLIDYDILLEIGEARTIREVEGVLQLYQLHNIPFTPADKRKIWNHASDVVAHLYVQNAKEKSK